MPIAATRREVAAQPEVVARVLDDQGAALRDLAALLAERAIDLVLASGSGDSWFAAQAVRLAFERYAGLPFEALQAYEYALYGRVGENAQTLHLVISSSGRPTTTWDALDRALATSAFVVGVTDNGAADNPFVARPARALVPGARKVGWPAQTTTATIALLLDLAIALGRARRHLDEIEGARRAAALREVPAQMATVLERAASWAERLAATLDGRRNYVLVGGGPGHAVAQIGSALLAEGPQRVGLPLTLEEFHHALRIGTIEAGDPVILLAPESAGSARAQETADSVRAWGGRLIPLVSGQGTALLDDSGDGLELPRVPEPLSPLLTLLPLHLLSIALAARRVAAGYERPRSVP